MPEARICVTIDHIHRKGMTVMVVTHDANVAVHADKVIYLEDCQIMDTLQLGLCEDNTAAERDVQMKSRLKKMHF